MNQTLCTRKENPAYTFDHTKFWNYMVEHGEGLLETPATAPSLCCLVAKDPEHLQAAGLGTLQGRGACRGTQLICTIDTVGWGLLPSERMGRTCSRLPAGRTAHLVEVLVPSLSPRADHELDQQGWLGLFHDPKSDLSLFAAPLGMVLCSIPIPTGQNHHTLGGSGVRHCPGVSGKEMKPRAPRVRRSVLTLYLICSAWSWACTLCRAGTGPTPTVSKGGWCGRRPPAPCNPQVPRVAHTAPGPRALPHFRLADGDWNKALETRPMRSWGLNLHSPPYRLGNRPRWG